MSALLEVDALDAGYGQFQALFGVNIEVNSGEAVAVIGANGAGKTTLMRAIAGAIAVRSGGVRFKGQSLVGLAAHKRVAMGVALVPEGRRIFPSLSVDENLAVGAHSGRSGPWTRDKVLETLPLLQRITGRAASRLSGGEQQALAIGRALMSNPELLCMDEVSLGLAPVVVKQLYEALPAIRNEGVTVVLVEQDINQAMASCERATCLLEGRVSLAGACDALTREQITAAYFGAVHS
jgi:branched-chain amino acid transport system ATP-binding protein